MLTTVLRNFQCYDLYALLKMPFCHFHGLFEMAEVAGQTAQYDIMIGTRCANTQSGKDLSYSVESYRLSDSISFKDIVTDKAKETAEQYLKRIKANG